MKRREALGGHRDEGVPELLQADLEGGAGARGFSYERSATIRRPAASCSTTASAAELSATDSSPSSPGSPAVTITGVPVGSMSADGYTVSLPIIVTGGGGGGGKGT